MKQRWTQRGISLLEMMLVLVVIASILLVVIHYYTQTSQQQRVSSTLKQLDRITLASSHWERAHRDDSHMISMDSLVQSGLLIPEDVQNVWGGGVTVSEDSEHHVAVSMSGLPKNVCRTLVTAWSSGEGGRSSHCTDQGEWQGDVL